MLYTQRLCKRSAECGCSLNEKNGELNATGRCGNQGVQHSRVWCRLPSARFTRFAFSAPYIHLQSIFYYLFYFWFCLIPVSPVMEHFQIFWVFLLVSTAQSTSVKLWQEHSSRVQLGTYQKRRITTSEGGELLERGTLVCLVILMKLQQIS